MTYGMRPAERAELCGQCRLERCNESSPDCLIQIRGLEKKVGRKRRTRAVDDEGERKREACARRAVVEILAFKRITPETQEELIGYYR